MSIRVRRRLPGCSSIWRLETWAKGPERRESRPVPSAREREALHTSPVVVILGLNPRMTLVGEGKV